MILVARLPTPQRAWAGYNYGLARQPLLTKSLTSLVGFALGDTVAQLASRGRGYDWYRTLRLSVYGALVAGPVGHYWFQHLDKTILPAASRSPTAIVSKIMLDQMAMAPIGTGLFFAVMKLMDNQATTILPTLQEKLVPTLQASWCLWPAAHVVNFAFVPSSQRILYINFVSIFWTFLLSQAASGSSAKESVIIEPVAAGVTQLIARYLPPDEDLATASLAFVEQEEDDDDL